MLRLRPLFTSGLPLTPDRSGPPRSLASCGSREGRFAPRALFASVVLAAAAITGAASAQPASWTFSDQTFNSADWSLTWFGNNSATAVQDGTVGDPSPSRKVQHSVGGGVLSVCHLNLTSGAVFDPSTFSVGQVVLTVESRYISGAQGNGQGLGLACEQDGVLYRSTSSPTFASPQWVLQTRVATPDTFVRFDGLPGTPDFSASGTPIRFGYRTGNSAGPYNQTTAYDNLTIIAFPDSDGDGVLDAADNCPGVANPDQLDYDLDGSGDACDPDDDNDLVADASDDNPLNQNICHDLDGDGCDDCSGGSENSLNDGLDTDGDGACNTGDADDDNDGILDDADTNPTDRFSCGDSDGDGCDDCNSGLFDTLNDGPDFDADGTCDIADTDDDGDGVPDFQDADSLNGFVCADSDGDGCDDCASGFFLPASDGADFDGDGMCDSGDDDDDNDGLSDLDESSYGTDPFNNDSDWDGLLDGTEVNANIDLCPNPAIADSDGDTLFDGNEVVAGTNPCAADSDGDTVPDNLDPTPLQPGVPPAYLERALRDAAQEIRDTPEDKFDGNNPNARKGKRASLAGAKEEAANAVKRGNKAEAKAHNDKVKKKVDDQGNDDWMPPSPPKSSMHSKAQQHEALIDQLP